MSLIDLEYIDAEYHAQHQAEQEEAAAYLEAASSQGEFVEYAWRHFEQTKQICRERCMFCEFISHEFETETVRTIERLKQGLSA